MSLSPQFLDELRARTSLSGLIGRTVTIKKAGTEYKGCCPFHGEKTPSFYVNDAKGFYHCFGCSAHGDAITWLTDQQGLPFIDAVKELAAAAGMEMPAADSRQAERDRELTEMREIMARAARHYRDRAEHGLDYRRSRDIPDAIAHEFDIGAAPRPNRAPPLHEAMKDVAVEKLMTLGLVKRREDGERAGEIYDTFRGRLMFPIHDARGRVIAFGGRIIGQGEPKYLNSPDTPLFDKGRTLFNAHRAAPAARKSGRLIIVEGYMDVIALARADVLDAVAPNGTALTEHQIALAWRMADVPILCMDGDKAGRAAMARAAIKALPILEPGKSLSFVTPPDGKDPDDLLRERGAEAVQALFAKPRPLVDVLWSHERDAEPCDTPEQVAGLKSRLRAHVRSIRSPDVREAYGQEVAKRFRSTFDAISEGIVRDSGPQIRSRPTERTPFSRSVAPPPASQAAKQIGRAGIGGEIERAVLLGLVRFPEFFRICGRVKFRNHAIQTVVETLSEYVFLNEIDTEAKMRDQIEDLRLTDEISRLTDGHPVQFRFARPVIGDHHRPAARADLEAALKAMGAR